MQLHKGGIYCNKEIGRDGTKTTGITNTIDRKIITTDSGHNNALTKNPGKRRLQKNLGIKFKSRGSSQCDYCL